MRPSLLSLLAALAFSLSAAYAGPKDDLMAADKAFSDLSVAKGSNAAFLSYVTDDVRLFGIGTEPPIYGKAAAQERFKTSGNGDPATNVLSWTPANAVLSDDGTIGWTDGVWTFVGAPNAKGERPKESGHYLTVWKKNARGEWKVAADLGTVDLAPSK